MRTLDEILAEAERRIDRVLNEGRYRTRILLRDQGATWAEQDATMEWLEGCIDEAISDALATIREELTKETRH